MKRGAPRNACFTKPSRVMVGISRMCLANCKGRLLFASCTKQKIVFVPGVLCSLICLYCDLLYYSTTIKCVTATHTRKAIADITKFLAVYRVFVFCCCVFCNAHVLHCCKLTTIIDTRLFRARYVDGKGNKTLFCNFVFPFLLYFFLNLIQVYCPPVFDVEFICNALEDL